MTSGRRTRKIYKKKVGAGLFSGIGLNAPLLENSQGVTLTYSGKVLKCDVCNSDQFSEIQSSIDKSKVRTIVRDMILGDDSGQLDNTSVILYVCQTCGYSKMVRNNGKQRIVATPAPAPATSG